MREKDYYINEIEKYIVEPYKSELIAEIKPLIRMRTTGIESEEIGKTKFGGSPDLPKDFNWIRSNNNEYLPFLGQVNLKEITEYDELRLLPKSGILYFYYNWESDEGRVIYSEETELEKTCIPEELKPKKKTFLKRLLMRRSTNKVLKESSVEIYKDYNYPSWDSLSAERIYKMKSTQIKPINLFLNSNEADRYIYDEREDDSISNHHLLGNYEGIQHQFIELNFFDYDDAIEDLSLTEINEALKWKLLFQFDSDDNLEINWGDWGRIYFFIQEKDLKEQNFDKIKISTSCY